MYFYQILFPIPAWFPNYEPDLQHVSPVETLFWVAAGFLGEDVETRLSRSGRPVYVAVPLRCFVFSLQYVCLLLGLHL